MGNLLFSQEEPVNRQQLTHMYMEYLTEEGYNPSLDADGDVRFKAEGFTYYIIIDEKDERYFRLLFPNFWSIDDGEELARALVAANYATMVTKVAKVYVREDGKDTSAAIEMFVDPPEQFKSTFPRCMSALRASVNTFVEKMKELAK